MERLFGQRNLDQILSAFFQELDLARDVISAGSQLVRASLALLLFSCTVFLLNAERVYKVGDRGPAGGIVFYDKGEITEGWRYLEAAPGDASKGISWAIGDADVKVNTENAIGTGKANTKAIIEAQGEGVYAALLCRNLTTGGYNDWFLPSRAELELLWTVLAKNGLGGFDKKWYWSSTRGKAGSVAWYQFFLDGDHIGSRNLKLNVRAVRSF